MADAIKYIAALLFRTASPSAELMIWNLKDHEVSALACPGYFTSKKSFGCFARRLNELGAKEHSLEKLV